MTRYYEIQRKRQLQFRRNNNLPIAHTSQLHESYAGRRKRRREDERQETHEKRMQQDMEHALDLEQQQEDRQTMEMRQALERHTSMTTDEQRETIRDFKSTQKTERKRSYDEINDGGLQRIQNGNDTGWQNLLSKTTRPYASKQEMTRHYEILRKRKTQFRRNNNLPIAHTSQLHESYAGRRKRRREDERQETHEKRMQQDMEHALDLEQQQEDRQTMEMRQALERHTSMTTDEQRETIRDFKSTQKTERKRSYDEINDGGLQRIQNGNDTGWQNLLSKTTRPYASKQEMTRHYEIQRKRKLQFRRNNNLPIAQTRRLYENSAGRRKRRREDERQETHEKRMQQDMEHALDLEQQQEDRQTMEMRQALETNTRRYEWLRHREFENEPITRISINEQDAEEHETYTREQWRAWDNYDERQREIENREF